MCISPIRHLIYTLLIPLLLHQTAQATTNSSASETIDPPIIFIGHKPTHHYVIIIIPNPQDDQVRSQLARIHSKMAPTGQIPFMGRNHVGRYIYAASFTSRYQAEITRRQFLQDESSARVVYFP
jgi:hypothetical protein